MPPACLWIDQIWQPGPFSTLSYYLPGPVAIYAEDEHLALSLDWAATLDVVRQHLQGIAVDGECPDPAVLLFLSDCLLHLCPASWAISVTPAEPYSTHGAGQSQTALEVLDGDGTMSKVYILDFQT